MKLSINTIIILSYLFVPVVFAGKLEECVDIEDNTKRLSCFDSAMEEIGDVPKVEDGLPNIIKAFRAEGIKLSGVTLDQPNPDSPLPKSYDQNWYFVDDDLANGKGGQIFMCSKKSYCDSIYAYFDALKGLAGPYLFRNADGTIIAQLNSGHTPASAERYEKVLSKN